MHAWKSFRAWATTCPNRYGTRSWTSWTRMPIPSRRNAPALGSRHPAEAPGLEIRDGFADLSLAVRDEGTMAHHRLIDRLPAEHQHDRIAIGLDRGTTFFAAEQRHLCFADGLVAIDLDASGQDDEGGGVAVRQVERGR